MQLKPPAQWSCVLHCLHHFTCVCIDSVLQAGVDSEHSDLDDNINGYDVLQQEMQHDLIKRLVGSGYVTRGSLAWTASRIIALACSTGFVGKPEHVQSIISLGGWPVHVMQLWLQSWQVQLQQVGEYAVRQHLEGLASIESNDDIKWLSDTS
jgi:hypothetical protein